MMGKKMLDKKLKEYQIKEYMSNVLDKPGYSHVEITRTPLGEKITVFTSKPGLIVGRKGSIIKELTEVLKRKFGLENPQIEVSEVPTPYLNPQYIAKNIVHTFERFGPSRFKYLGHKLLESIMEAGALGAEIVISGRGVPSKRSKTWRFSTGHLKKSGDIAVNYVKRGFAAAHLKSGTIGVKVSILTPDTILPDEIKFKEIEKPGEVKVEALEEKVPEEKKETKEEKTPKPEEKETKEEKPKEQKKEEMPKEKQETKKEDKKETPDPAPENKSPEESSKKSRKIITAKELDEKVPSILELAEKRKWQS
jgi:small subunit ribosomal protein S3